MDGQERREPHHGIDHLILDDHVWAERLAVAAWVIAGCLFAAMAIGPVRDAIESFDRWFFDLVYPIKWGPLTALSYLLAFLGSAIFIWPLRVVVTAVLIVKKRWVALAAWLVPILLSEPLIGSLKAAYGRERPPEALVTEITGSFPSGHAVAGAVVALSLVIVLVPRGPARRNLEMGAAVFVFLMAGSRIYLGAHWLTDVLAGVALGAACSIGGAALVQRWFRSRNAT